ncbi:ORC1-type DNA replication protein 1 [uncultured archaeon]|nr:ORC1-type DNA replication protein 1 [uncultured archaeon]
MGNLFTHVRSEEQSIIIKEEALMPEYFPEELVHRDAEMNAVAEAVKPLINCRQPENIFVYGDSGTGKTTCMKHILKELEGHTFRVETVYANCWEHSTRMAVYSLIVNALRVILPRRGLATDEVFDRILEAMEKKNVRVLVVLDELDGLFFHNEERLLHDLACAGKGKPFFGIIGISNDRHLFAEKDIRIKSSLRLTELEFKHYTSEQMSDILTERANMGLLPGSWDKRVMDECAKRAVDKNSNVRIGLELLWKAAKHADKQNKKKITIEDVEFAGAKMVYDSKSHVVESEFELRSKSLSDEERLILEILKNGAKTSSEVYPAFCRKMMRTKRQIRNYVKALEAKKLIVAEDIEGYNSMLNTKKIRLSWEEAKK